MTIRPVNANIMTPGCVMTPNICHVRTLTLPRPASPPSYSPPSPMYRLDPTPSADNANAPVSGEISPGSYASGSASVNG